MTMQMEQPEIAAAWRDLTGAQRRFLEARVLADTDHAALVASGGAVSTLHDWKSLSPGFKRVYEELITSTKRAVGALVESRLPSTVEAAVDVLDRLFDPKREPTRDEVAVGELALKLVKEYRQTMRGGSTPPPGPRRKVRNGSGPTLDVTAVTHKAMAAQGAVEEVEEEGDDAG